MQTPIDQFQCNNIMSFMSNCRTKHQACMLALAWLLLQAHSGAAQRSAHGLTRAVAQMTEESYWRSRHAAELTWRMRIPNATVGTLLSIPGVPMVRFWDVYAADYSCPFVRVRAYCSPQRACHACLPCMRV